MSSKTLGIIGGMGPEATVDLMMKIIKKTPAKVEQDHIRVIADNNPHIPCRIKAIMENAESSGPMMVEMAKNLEKAGADFLVIACNTAHYYFKDVEAAVNIPVLNIIDETVKVLLQEKVQKVTLLATKANIYTGLYDKALNQTGIELVLPSEAYQEKVLDVIAKIKAGKYEEARSYTDEIINHCMELGAEAVILGCTELPMAFCDQENLPIYLYDPADIISEVIVTKALN
ncbi:aspartate racemase [Desulfonispora thiosulfatigenes DSM 11270]|uniref:Aspartate racemase n=1 Tax=Desulfonispora thiosulfatigenes DSM 11270 TaxID=656914 RepID=A0A1W1VKC6_DESTI|nr:amino acid racemase [Desulfonispora thiosulfatigenes]SMB93743.1 aspartate racemase [Desulfonispora thiosulfatigenes DSM 11270]